MFCNFIWGRLRLSELSTNSISDPGIHKIYLLELKCRRESLTKYSFNIKKY